MVLIRSESGAGSTFEVTIRAPYAGSEVAMRAPRSKQERTAQKRTAQDPPSAGWKGRMASMDGGAPDALNGKKVLVVDDVQDNRILIERYLKPAGVEVGTASGGMEAIERVQGGSWDLVLMDIQMPNMDGYEATTQLRSLGFKKPIIALTAHAMKEELERCMRAGCDLAITKPISKPELVRRLQEAFRL